MSKQTPEGIVKDGVKKMLLEIGCLSAAKSQEVDLTHEGWYYMPVQNGMGVTSIPDFLGHYRGLFFAIETKAPGKKPTVRQQHHLDAIEATDGMAFVANCEEDIERIKRTLQGVKL